MKEIPKYAKEVAESVSRGEIQGFESLCSPGIFYGRGLYRKLLHANCGEGMWHVGWNIKTHTDLFACSKCKKTVKLKLLS